MITEDYVSFETAKLLKEKGFAGECSRFYMPNGHGRWKYEHYHDFDISDRIECPTLQMAMKWLREVHHIFINIDWDARPEPKGFGNKPYFSLIINMNIGDFYKGKDLPSEFTSYEEAAEAAIKYCLENCVNFNMTEKIDLEEAAEKSLRLAGFHNMETRGMDWKEGFIAGAKWGAEHLKK